MLWLEARLHQHWNIPLFSSGKVHSMECDWLLVQWMGILVCVYTGLLNILQVWYWVTAHFTFCLPAGAVELVSVVLVVYSAHYSSDFYISPLSPPWVGQVVWGLYPSFRPGQLCGNSLARARGILNDRRHGDVYVVCLGGSIAVCVPLQGDVGG